MNDSEESRNEPAAAAQDAATRKPYVKPELVEYGNVARLTETSGVSTRDGAGPRKRND